MTAFTSDAMLASLANPEQLQVFAAMVAVTGPGRQQSWPGEDVGLSFLTPTGAAKRTGLSPAAALESFLALETVGLAIPYPDNARRNGWRLNTEALTQTAQATSRGTGL